MGPFSGHLIQLILGGILALMASFIGSYMGWLSLSGTFAAFGVGLIVFGLGGLSWAVLLLLFFISSSLFSVLFKTRKHNLEGYADKGSRRDSRQVLANGGLAGIFVILNSIFPHSWWTWVGFAAAFAAANADTWATEIGPLSKTPPILITSGKIVARGTSGGISLVGSLGSVFGSAVVALAAWALWPIPTGVPNVWIFLAIFCAGIFGSLVDSFLGARLQRVNFCPKCEKETEKSSWHSCGYETIYLRGWKWLDNDWVNFFCTLSAVILAIALVGGAGLLR
jgi:uncharacterized protein (TIGR00297 family)